MVKDILDEFIPSADCQHCHNGGGCGYFKCKSDKPLNGENSSTHKGASKLALNFLSHPQIIFSAVGQTQTDKLPNQEVKGNNILSYKK